MSNIRLIAFDLDNTLLSDRTVLMSKSAAALTQAEQQGIKLVIATTRGYDFTRVLAQLMGWNDPIIASNGAEIGAAPFGPLWALHTIPQAAAQPICELADEQGWKLIITVGAITRYHVRPDQRAGMLIPSRPLVERNIDALTGDVTRMLIHNQEAAQALKPLCETTLSQHCRTETYYKPDGRFHSFGIFPKLADKGTALELVLEQLEISAESCLAIGDNFNDVPMFNKAGISVAMGNAVDAVKQTATHVAPSFQEDGVAWAVQKFIL